MVVVVGKISSYGGHDAPYLIEEPHLKPVKRTLKDRPKLSTSSYLGDENGPRGVSALGYLQGPFSPALGAAL